jgi:hypothetical protein
MNCLLLRAKHGISGLLRLKAGMLHQELGTLVLELQTQNLHHCTIQEWGYDKLTGLLEAGLGVLPECWPKKPILCFPSFSISFRLFSMMMALSTRC